MQTFESGPSLNSADTDQLCDFVQITQSRIALEYNIYFVRLLQRLENDIRQISGPLDFNKWQLFLILVILACRIFISFYPLDFKAWELKMKWTSVIVKSDITGHSHTNWSKRLKLLVQPHCSLTHLSLVRALYLRASFIVLMSRVSLFCPFYKRFPLNVAILQKK